MSWKRVFLGSLLPMVVVVAHAQMVLRPTGIVDLPPGAWADTVLTTFDLEQPIGTLRRVDQLGDERATYAVFATHPATALKGLMGRGLVANGTDGALTLKVNRLRVDEIENRSICILHGEVLRRTGGRTVRLFESSVLTEADRCGNKESCHADNVRQALADFFELFKAGVAEGGPASPSAPSDATMAFRIDEKNTPVLAAVAPKRGLYRNFMQFRTNTPDLSQDFELKEAVGSPGDGSVVRVKHLNGEEREDCWGLSDGNHAYVRVGRTFVRLIKNGDGYLASVPMPQDASAIVMGGLFFGAIGAAVVAASTAPTEPLLCELNMLGGDLVPRDPGLRKKDYGMNIFHVTRFAKYDAPIRVTCENMPPVELGKGQWTGLELPPQAGTRNVVVEGTTNHESVPISTNSDKVRVYLINVKKDGAVSVSELGEQMRDAVVKDLKKEDRR